MAYIISIALVLLSALFSGLTLGFFSLNKDDLERKAKLGGKRAKKIYRVRKDGNLLLCTLLIGNVAVNSTLSIFLGSIASGFMAGLIATGLIVIFGEIIPQAAFSRYALTLGAKLVWLVRIFLIFLYPICKPIAWLLDKALGDEVPAMYSKKELIDIIEAHEHSEDSDIDLDEEKIIKGALSFSDKTAKDIMTPKEKMFFLPFSSKLSKKIVSQIFETGHSRIPIYKKNKDNVVGILYAKDLIINNHAQKTIGSVARPDVIFVHEDKKLDDLLAAFKKVRHHLFLVLDNKEKLKGLVTIEDVIEEIIGEEIVDEFDQFENIKKGKKVEEVKRIV